MSANREFEFDARLVDLHLGRLSDSERDQIHQRLSEEPTLAAQNELLASVFGALNCLRSDALPAGFGERLHERIAATSAPFRVVAAASETAATGARSHSNRDNRESFRWVLRAGNFRDLIAAAAMIVLVIGMGVPAMLHMRETNHRIGCSANLARLGQGLAAYASTFNQSLPFAGWGSWNSWQPSSNPQMQVVQNRQHLVPLLPSGTIDRKWLICPSTKDIPLANNQRVIDASNLSYAYQNMAGVRPSLADNPNLVVLADDNPLFDDGRPLVDLRVRLGVADPASVNSRAHGGYGQNVLTLNGRVVWSDTPNVGVNGDNIWTLANVQSYTGREGPATATDSHLLK
ncbi:MAG: hypothetical protein JNG88_03185 [Phycisphaerales bacterium]|nr:hypothetical protein [Phycisphaerales bacterium]